MNLNKEKHKVLLVYSPAKIFGHSDFVSKGQFEHPKALRFCDCELGLKFGEEFAFTLLNKQPTNLDTWITVGEVLAFTSAGKFFEAP